MASNIYINNPSYFELNKQNPNDALVLRIADEIIKNKYALLILFMGNFVLDLDKEGKAYPLIPEEYISDPKNINLEKHESSLAGGNKLFDTSFSYTSLQLGLGIQNYLQKNMGDIQIVPLLSGDDKYIPYIPSRDFFSQGYAAIPSSYRTLLERFYGGHKNVRKEFKIIPEMLMNSGQGNINNLYLLSEKGLVNRFNNIKSRSRDLSVEYELFEQSLGMHRKSCMLELFHLLKTIQVHKETILTKKSLGPVLTNPRTCMLQFVADACQGSALISSKNVVENDDTFDVINVIPDITGSSLYVINKITKNKSELL